MNLESLKGALKRAQAWIKKNPKKAAAVAVVIVIVAYFAIKRGSQASGEELASQVSDDSTGLDSLGGGLASSGGASDSGGAIGTISDSLASSGAGTSGGAFSNSDSSGVDYGGGGYDLSGYDSFLSPAGGDFSYSPSFPASTASIISAPKTSEALRPASIPAQVTSKAVDIVKPASSPVVSTPAIKSAKTSNNVASKTDAEKAGLPKFFTGVSGGYIYAAGVRTGKYTAPKTTATPASKTSNKIASRI